MLPNLIYITNILIVIGNYNCTVFGNWECTENGNKDAPRYRTNPFVWWYKLPLAAALSITLQVILMCGKEI